jgi:hypothetical protein
MLTGLAGGRERESMSRAVRSYWSLYGTFPIL